MRLEFEPRAFADLQHWIATNARMAKKVMKLIVAIRSKTTILKRTPKRPRRLSLRCSMTKMGERANSPANELAAIHLR